MTKRFWCWLIVASAVILQFLFEVTLSRVFVAPAILIPVLVYLSQSESDYWAIEGAFWSGFALDLLLNQPIGISSLSMLLGISFSNWVLRKLTGAHELTFLVNTVIASIVSDLIFILFASRPIGAGFGGSTFFIIPRILVPVLLYFVFPLFWGKRARV